MPKSYWLTDILLSHTQNIVKGKYFVSQEWGNGSSTEYKHKVMLGEFIFFNNYLNPLNIDVEDMFHVSQMFSFVGLIIK